MLLKLPELGENITEGAVTKILVKVGDRIQKGQSILEIETDKAVLEVPCACEGVIKEILIKSGAVIKVGQPIFRIETATPTGGNTQDKASPTGGHVPEGYVSPSTVLPTGGHDFSRVPTQAAEQVSIEGESTPGKQPSAKQGSIPIRNDIPAAPSARLLARELGIDLAQVPGSGLGGRISNGDVKAYCKMLNTSRAQAFELPQPPLYKKEGASLPDFTKWGPVHREAMNNVRKKTAEHLSLAWSTIPHVTQCDKADITQLEKLRKSISGAKKRFP